MTGAHIASLILHAPDDRARSVATRIARTPGTEVHAVEGAKIIVVLEAATERALADRMEALRREPDVLLVNLVYHEVDLEAP